jgi:hypothetical protein
MKQKNLRRRALALAQRSQPVETLCSPRGKKNSPDSEDEVEAALISQLLKGALFHYLQFPRLFGVANIVTANCLRFLMYMLFVREFG